MSHAGAHTFYNSFIFIYIDIYRDVVTAPQHPDNSK